MLDTFDRLSQNLPRSRSRSPIDCSFVTVELVEEPRPILHHSGIVWIDGRNVGHLVGNQPREFRLAPGQHSIKIGLGWQARIAGFPELGIVSTRIELKPGERMELACGAENPAADRWLQHAKRVRWFSLGSSLLLSLVIGLFWLLAPILKPSILEAIRLLRWWEVLAHLSKLSPVQFRIVFSAHASFAALLLAGLPFWIWERRASGRLLDEVGSPYRLGPRREST